MTSMKCSVTAYKVDERQFQKRAARSPSFSASISYLKSSSVVEPTGAGKDSHIQKKETKPERGQWGSSVEFILACIGYSVGLGNVWRFPYLVFSNGGGAFLIPYIVAVVVAGRPIYFLELCLGQYAQVGSNVLFGNMAPLFAGIGYGMVVISALCSIYYNMIIAWVLFYFFASFRAELPWSGCENSWNTDMCRSQYSTDKCRRLLNDTGAYFFHGMCRSSSYVQEHSVIGKLTNASAYNLTWRSAADEYFHNNVLQIANYTDGSWTGATLGGMSWQLVLCLLLAWVLVFLCLFKGVQSTGKVVYFTATFPYVVLIILLIRGATLPGAIDGIKFYIVPTFNKLADAKVWNAAATQVFYSLGTTFGGLITMSSYNKFNNNCWRDALIVAVVDSGTSLFAGFAIFSIIGYMAHELNVPVQEVTKSGPGLAFVAYPEALSRMPIGPLWSILFFFMLVTLGLDSQFAMVETVTSAMLDQFASFRKYKHFLIAGTCFILFLLGLPLCTQSGMYIFELINDYSAGYCLILLALIECLVTVYCYGIGRFTSDIETMLGFKPGWYWRICWMGLTPLFLSFIFVFTFVDMKPPEYNGYVFGTWLQGIGWLLSLLSILCVPILALYKFLLYLRDKLPLVDLIRPVDDWDAAARKNKTEIVKPEPKVHTITYKGVAC